MHTRKCPFRIRRILETGSTLEILKDLSGFRHEELHLHRDSRRLLYAISETAEKCRAQAKERSRRYLERKRAKEDAERKAAGLEPRKRPSQMSEEEKAEHKEQQIKKSRERVKRYQQEHKDEIKARKARYYQENKNRYRVRDAIRRTKKSIEKFEAEGRDGMAEKARVRLAGFEKEYAEILKGA